MTLANIQMSQVRSGYGINCKVLYATSYSQMINTSTLQSTLGRRIFSFWSLFVSWQRGEDDVTGSVISYHHAY